MLDTARFIRAEGAAPAACPLFGRTVSVRESCTRASLTITARGVFEAYLNGAKIGLDYLAPGWTEYETRLLVQSYDVTDMLTSGENSLTVQLANGWYLGRIRGRNGRSVPRTAAILAELTIEYADGTVETVVTDDSWKWADSPLLRCEIYDGQAYDARIVPDFTHPVTVEDYDKSCLCPHDGAPVRAQERVRPRAIFTTPAGETVIDFGQNLSGVPEITVTAHAGEEIRFSCAEVLDHTGNVYTENYRSAICENTYICREGAQTYAPSLTFYGFRYLRVDAFPGEITADNITAIVLHTEMERTGWIDTGLPMVNQLMQNQLWGQKGNYLDIPTDCPQRDERHGWTGDAQIFVKTAAYNYDVKPFYTKWLRDMAVAQAPDGLVPKTIPNVHPNNETSAAWGDAGAVCPWQIYTTYGDLELLREHYPMMKKWVEYIRSVSGETNLWPDGGFYGDWLGLDAPYGEYRGSTEPDLVSAAYYAYSTSLVAKAAADLGYTEDAAEYASLREKIGQAFYEKWQDNFSTQTAYALALHFDLARDRDAVAANFVNRIHEDGDRLMTGFVGTPYLLHALSATGHGDVAWNLFLREEFPSWLYPVKMGATTMWEHWDGIRPDGVMWSKNMNSYNHYAYGSVADWIYERAAGITPLAPGFARIAIHPQPDARLGYLHVRFDSAAGRIEVKWQYEPDGRIRVRVVTPAETVLEGRTVPAGVYEYWK